MNENEEVKEQINFLENFIYNDEIQEILYRINNNIMDFNILEITGMGTYEIKHSNILAWLFDNNEHNLGYKIFDNFLKKVVEENEKTENAKFDILKKLKSYIYLAKNNKDITIYREKDNIDLLIIDEANKVVITIENKIFATERIKGITDDGQLSKYEYIINKKFNAYEKYFIFLTKNLDESKQGNEYWMIASHQMIADVIENILLKKQDLSIKTKLILESYIDLLKRRNIVESNELQELANRIWGNNEYKKALEILNEYKPDTQLIIKNYLENVLKGNVSINCGRSEKRISDYVNFEASSKAYIRFSDKEFDKFEEQNKGEGWHRDINKILVYEFNNLTNSLSLDLIVGPGEADAREKIFNIPLKDKYSARNFDKNNKRQWPRIFKTNIKLDKDTINEDEIKKELNKFFCKFFDEENGDFFKIRNQVYKELCKSSYSNEELWEIGLNFIDKHSDNNLIYNKNGTKGIFELKNSQFIIKTDKKEYIYNWNKNIVDILCDGWILE
jgi:hypothetical protein